MWQGLWAVPGSPSGVGASLGPLGPAAVRPVRLGLGSHFVPTRGTPGVAPGSCGPGPVGQTPGAPRRSAPECPRGCFPMKSVLVREAQCRTVFPLRRESVFP